MSTIDLKQKRKKKKKKGEIGGGEDNWAVITSISFCARHGVRKRVPTFLNSERNTTRLPPSHGREKKERGKKKNWAGLVTGPSVCRREGRKSDLLSGEREFGKHSGSCPY